MNYYRDLLASAFGVLSGNNTPKIMALVTSAERSSGTNETLNEPWPVGFLSASLPPGTNIQCLEGGESFINDATSAVGISKEKNVFAFPPLLGGPRMTAEWHDRFGRLDIAGALAETLMNQTDDGRQVEVLAMLVPTHFLSSLRSSSWRKEFFPAHSAVVIEHEHDDVPAALGLPFHSAVRLTTVFFRRQPGPIRFFKITTEALAEPPQRLASALQSLIKQPAGKNRLGYVYKGQLEDGYPCSHDYYSEETERLRQEIGVLGQRVALKSVADVLMGLRPCNPDQLPGNGEVGLLTIRAADITRDGRVDLSDIQPYIRPAIVRHYLKDGDFCIRSIYQGDTGFVVGVFEGDGRPVTFGHSVIVVRPHASLNSAQRQVLLSFLRSPLAHRLGNAKQVMSSMAGRYRVSPHVLCEFPVPIADEELVSSIQQLNDARMAFTKWISHIDEESNAILIESTAHGSRSRLLNAGQLARQRHRAGEQVEEFDYRVRTQFPHPLAYVWRELQVAGADRYHRFRAVTKAAEGHTCFLALIAVLMSRAAGQPIKYVGEIAKRLSQRRSGTNFGDWFAILEEVNEGKTFRGLKGSSPFVELTQLSANGTWEQAIRHLMALRNDDSHGRIAPASVSANLLTEAEKSLETVYRATEFLTDYQLLFITDTQLDSLRQINRFQYRDLTGDNALAQLREDQSSRADLEKNSLYLRDRQKNLHLFRPLLQYLECPECHQLSTFFLDTYDPASGGSAVGLKSFERNSVRTEPIAEDFRHVGLLPTI
ncbi:hypothetical protein EI77_01718 [Prosthecobacter fusiformis]|uniref:Restriction endonuclease n=1 Tax=Prosthecobacter fusiformis TaxID=48464 RepID=A0A4R7S5U3_9BACT|nr:hypothetical protein [Prosthecobacter fusiformis]TDU73249.1 hypothetical protein EI77_01718 [Prosthecobacter fusiformis]